MRDDIMYFVIVSLTALVFGGLSGFVTGLLLPDHQAGQVACQSINKTWALIDGQYMCVTVTP